MKIRLITLMLLCSLVATVLGQTPNYPTTRINGKLVYKYTTEKSIGLYRISKMFDVRIDDITDLNPQLKERAPQENEILYIPVPGAPIGQAEDTIDPVIAQLPHYRIDLIMPFHKSKQKQRLQLQEERMNEFYRGVLMALYETPQKDSVFIDLYVHNSGNDAETVTALITDRDRLVGTNGIIGPFYVEQVKALSPWIKEHQVPTILPTTSDESYLSDNPYLMQYNSTSEQERKTVMEYLTSSNLPVHCIFIQDSTTDESTLLMQKNIQNNELPVTIIDSTAVVHDSLKYILHDNAENIVFFSSNKYKRNKCYIDKIDSLYPQHKIAIFGTLSWLTKPINAPLIYTSTFVTEQEADMKAYDEIWDKYFKKKQLFSYPRYDLLGYDLTRKMIGILTNKNYPGAQSDIYFEPYVEGGAMINSHIQVLRTE